MSVKTMSRVWDHSEQTSHQLVLMLALANRSDDDGVCLLHTNILAKRARITEWQAELILNQLENANEIYIAHDVGRTNAKRCFVMVGLDKTTIFQVLTERFDVPTRDAFSFTENLKAGQR